jgi:hypothetical protein
MSGGASYRLVSLLGVEQDGALVQAHLSLSCMNLGYLMGIVSMSTTLSRNLQQAPRSKASSTIQQRLGIEMLSNKSLAQRTLQLS